MERKVSFKKQLEKDVTRLLASYGFTKQENKSIWRRVAGWKQDMVDIYYAEPSFRPSFIINLYVLIILESETEDNQETLAVRTLNHGTRLKESSFSFPGITQSFRTVLTKVASVLIEAMPWFDPFASPVLCLNYLKSLAAGRISTSVYSVNSITYRKLLDNLNTRCTEDSP